MSRLIGVISDTHNKVRPEAVARLRRCELIIHAGDVCRPEVLKELERLAPVVAVRGNNALLIVTSNSRLTGTLDLFTFGKASFSADSMIDGSLNCGSGSDAWCADPLATVNGTSNCGLCPKP